MPFSSEKFIVLESVASTNKYAMALIQNARATHGCTVFAHAQTEGKGRLGRTWMSEPGKNILLSVITAMEDHPVHQQFILSMIAANAVCDLIRKYFPLQPFVKWPNDIVINDRKAAGILIENLIRGTNWQWAITGFGINVNQDDFTDLPEGTSILLETHQAGDVMKLAEELVRLFLSGISAWREKGGNQIVKTYNNQLYMRGKMVIAEADDRQFETKIVGVTKEGKLVTKDEGRREWSMNELKIKI